MPRSSVVPFIATRTAFKAFVSVVVTREPADSFANRKTQQVRPSESDARMIPKIFRVWYQNNSDGDFVPLDTARPLWLSQSTPIPSAQPTDYAVGIHPIAPRAHFIGVAIVPVELHASVAINGTPVGSGMHGLRHADRLDLNGHSVWIAASLSVEPTAYDPAVHGEPKHCFISKMPLVAGQAIVLCPGRPGVPCNVIYAQESWEMVMQTQTQLRCANCRFHPDDAEWRPIEHQPRKRINDVLATIINESA